MKEERMKIGVIGIGKLGLCFALNLTESGMKSDDDNFFEVIGVDVSEEYVNAVNAGTLKSEEPGVERLLMAPHIRKHFRATTNYRDIADCETVFVLVATPSKTDGQYDHSQVDKSVRQLTEHASYQWGGKNKNLVIGCTVMPGYCDELQRKVEPFGYDVSYNPEFIAQGSIINDQKYPDMVLIGEANEQAGNRIQGIMATIAKNEPKFARMGRKEAEITKIALNCFLTTKIAFANLVGDVAIASGVRPEVILNAIGADSRIGNKYLGYGFGFGGPCFPRDNIAFGIYADKMGVPATIPRATDEANSEHLKQQLRFFSGNVPKEVPVVFDHVTYKKNSNLIVHSQQLAFAYELANLGYEVTVRERKSVIEEISKITLSGGKPKYAKINFIERES